MGKKRSPDYSVHSPTIGSGNGKVSYARIGAGWKKTNANGAQYLSVRLDFVPPAGTLVLWPWTEHDTEVADSEPPLDDIPPPGDSDVPPHKPR